MRTKVPLALLCLLLTTCFLSCVLPDDSDYLMTSDHKSQKLETRTIPNFKMSISYHNGSTELREAQKAIISTLADSSITVKIFVDLSDSTEINCKQIVCIPKSYQLKMKGGQWPNNQVFSGMIDLKVFKSAASDYLQLASSATITATNVKALIVEETDGF